MSDANVHMAMVIICQSLGRWIWYAVVQQLLAAPSKHQE